MSYEPGLDLVVVSYRTPDDLDGFCESLAENEPTVPWELKIVNVDPLPADKEVADRWCARWSRRAECARFDWNAGYSLASNRGASRGSRETIAIFNADVRLWPDTLNDCFWALKDDPKRGALGPRQVDDEHRLTAAGIFGADSAPAHRGWKEFDFGQYRDIRDDAVFVSGAALFTPRRVWDEMAACPVFRTFAPQAEGAFLQTFHYYSDTSYGYHLRAHGYRCTYLGSTTCTHRWHRSSPVGGHADQNMPLDRQIFRDFLDLHGVAHD